MFFNKTTAAIVCVCLNSFFGFRFHCQLKIKISETQEKGKKFIEKVNSECTEKEMGMLRMLNKEIPQDKYPGIGKKVRSRSHVETVRSKRFRQSKMQCPEIVRMPYVADAILRIKNKQVT